LYTEKQIREAGLDDFRVFLCQVWDHLGLPEPTPVQLDIAYTLQHGPRRIVIEAFRGVGKSWITAAFVLWLLFIDPQRKIIVVSASQALADNFSIFCKSLIHEMPLLQHLAPRGNQRDSNLAFDVGPASPDPAPSVKSAGLTGQITGSRADYIIGDDIEVPKNSFTHVLRERTAELVKEFDAILKPGGRVVYLGTPQVEASLYNKLPKRGYRIFVWPAELPVNAERYHGRLAQFIVKMMESGLPAGTPVEPTRFDREDLNERLASYGRSGYALQFMLDTNPSEIDRHPLKLRDLLIQHLDDTQGHVKLVWGQDRDQVLQTLHAGGFDGDVYHRPAWKSEEMAQFTGTVMAIDPSGRGSDETAYAIVRFLYGQLFLVAVGGFKAGFAEETLAALAAKAARYGVNDIICEENYGGGMFTQLLKPHVWKVCKARFIEQEDINWSKGQKELRIMDVMEPLLNSHRLVVDQRVIEGDLKVQEDTERYSFVYQLTRMSRDKGALANEDRLEAVAMACGYWVEKMDRDKDKMHEKHKDELLEQELRHFMDNAFSFGASNTVPDTDFNSSLNWMDN
jgi:hypothetical protein